MRTQWADASLRTPKTRGHDQDPRVLQAQIDRFEVALNNLTQGVCFFDGARRLILANQRYAEIYQIPMDSIRPGMMLEEIVDLRFAAGTSPNMTREEYLDWRASIAISDQPSDTIVELTSGQTISIHHRPMPDGGWVATHEDITERRLAEQRLGHMARHDALTGLPNRVVFREYMDQEAGRRSRSSSLAVLCLDLDHFKYVNDTFGHAVGDALLCAVAERLRNNVRGNDVVVRLGGDEFALLQIGVDQPQQSTALARRIIEILRHPFELGTQQVAVGASVGIAYDRHGRMNAEELLKNADMALYRAKDDGRGTFRFFDPLMNSQAQARHVLESGLRTALANDEFAILFQPILDAQTGALNRLEALVRWQHPRRGLIEPSEFIPVAEEIGLIVPIGEWTLQEACRRATEWPGDVPVAVNLSPAQLRNANLRHAVRGALHESGLPPGRLELEITETALLQNTAETLGTLHRLRALGVAFSLDDFGTGFSSIGCLRTFPFDRIKIDRSFIRDLKPGSDAGAIVRAIVDLGNALGMSVTAEGVETEEQLRMLRAESCAEVQGYLFSPPVAAEDVVALIARIRAAAMDAGELLPQ
jgi:diguanylate cyclase (GGDEF)-like protein